MSTLNLIWSIALFTSWRATYIFAPLSISTKILAMFSDEDELMSFIPEIDSSLFSIFFVTASSISSGDSPTETT